MERKRLAYTTFSLPVNEFRRGYNAAVYFWRTKIILEREGNAGRGVMQVFNKVDGAIVCGIDETLALLRLCTGYWKDYEKMYPLFDEYILLKQRLRVVIAQNNYEFILEVSTRINDVQRRLNELWVDTHEELKIHALHDGDQSSAHEAILTIEGEFSHFAHLESVYLGILARGTKVATNTKAVVDAARGKPILFFADRFDRYGNQVADGYAAMKAGALGVATDAMGKWWGMQGLGTIPHALIAMYHGDTAAATLAFAKQYPGIKLISLVDFHNDCVRTSLEVANACRENGVSLHGVRLDTSGTMVDKSVHPFMGQFKPTGVCAPLVHNVRNALDQAGHEHVQIVVSGGFNPVRIAEFERSNVPADAYGVGSSLLEGNFDHTADIVVVNGQSMAKVGRRYNPSLNLKPFNWGEIEP